MAKPIQIDSQEWYFFGCFIQKHDDCRLPGRYTVFQDDELQTHIDNCHTMAKAKSLCELNEVRNPHMGIKSFI
jgi:hypothetical protein